MISLSTITQNLNGNLIFNESLDSKIKTNTSRFISVPTLDGGSVPIHSGVTDLDRPLSIKGKISEEQEEKIWSFLNNESFLLMVHKTEIFLITIKSLSTDNGNLNMTLIISNKEN